MMRNRVGKSARAAVSAVNTWAGQRRHRPDYTLFAYVAIIILLGLIFMFAIGPQRVQLLNLDATSTTYDDNYFLFRQMTSIGIAMIGLIAALLIPHQIIKKYAKAIMGAALGACFLLFLFGNVLGIDAITKEVLGAYRWFQVGNISFQPSEFLKLGVLLYFAYFLSKRIESKTLNELNKTIIPLMTLVVVVLGVVAGVQKDLGTAAAMIAIVVAMLVVSGMEVKRLGAIFGVLLALGSLAILVAPHRMQRLQTFLGGTSATSQVADNTPGNYHIDQAHIAIGTGGILGVGIGNSIQAAGYLPEAINDSVFAIIGETFGFVGVVLLLCLFAVLLLRILRIVEFAPDNWSRLVAAGVFGWLAAHIVFNIASMLGLMPLTGITLPLMSFGGTSMVFLMAALGLLFQISRYTIHSKGKKELTYANSSSRRRVGRTRNTGNSRARRVKTRT